MTCPHRIVHTYLAVGIEQLAAVTPNDSERVPPVRALHVGVKLVLRQRNARRLRPLGRSRRSRRHRNALPDIMHCSRTYGSSSNGCMAFMSQVG